MAYASLRGDMPCSVKCMSIFGTITERDFRKNPKHRNI